MRNLFSGLALVAIFWAQPAAAAPEYPWCAHYDMEGTVTNCSFVSFEQCSWTVSGVGGFCARNLFYSAQPSGHAPRSKKSKRSDF
jgi:hypothetical protein